MGRWGDQGAGAEVAAEWTGALDALGALLARLPSGAVTGVAVTVRLPSRSGEGRRLLQACAELERRHGLRIAVRHTGERDTYAMSLQWGGAARERE